MGRGVVGDACRHTTGLQGELQQGARRVIGIRLELPHRMEGWIAHAGFLRTPTRPTSGAARPGPRGPRTLAPYARLDETLQPALGQRLSPACPCQRQRHGVGGGPVLGGARR
jgi:hypothetical protein